MADSSGHGGSSDTGNVARKWFSYSEREHVLNLIEGPDEEDVRRNRKSYGDILKRFSIILRTISSKENQIDHSSFQKYCTETYTRLLEHFEWCAIPGTIHRLLAHAGQRIHLNDNYGLGSLSEESLESAHKMVRRFRELGARKCGLKENLTDVFTRWYVQSDPTIQAEARVYQCKNCFQLYHTSRSCKRKAPGPVSMDFLGNEDDIIVESFFLDL